MLYLDYSRKHGEWVPQPLRRPREPRGDRLPARDERGGERGRAGLRDDRRGVHRVAGRDAADRARAGSGSRSSGTWGGCTTRSATSSATRSTASYHQDELTFAMMYEYSEHFIMPLSHDEVVHLKGSLLREDAGRRLAEVRQPARAVRVPVHAAGQVAAVHGHRARAARASGTTTQSLDWHLLRRPDARRDARLSDAAGAACTACCRRCGSATATRAASSGSTRATRQHSVLSYRAPRRATRTWSSC